MPRPLLKCTTPGCDNVTPALQPLCGRCPDHTNNMTTKQKKGPQATPPQDDSLDVKDVDLFIEGLSRVLMNNNRTMEVKKAGCLLEPVEELQMQEDKRKFRDVFLALARKMNDA